MKLSRLYGRFSLLLAAPTRTYDELGYRMAFGSDRNMRKGGYTRSLGNVLARQRSPYGGNCRVRRWVPLKLVKCLRRGCGVCICWLIFLIAGELPESAGPVFLRLYVYSRSELGRCSNVVDTYKELLWDPRPDVS